MKKTILVTGASGAIGLAVAQDLVSRGFNVIGTFRREKNPAVPIDWFELDVNNPELCKNLIMKVSQEDLVGYVDCTGIHHSGPLMGLAEEHLNEMFQTNMLAPTKFLQLLLPLFSKKRAGSIVLMGSVSAHRMTRGHAVYSATKAGLEGLTKALASEMAKRNVRINIVLPGPVDSAMLRQSKEENGVDPAEMVPMGRLIRAEEIAKTCSFLLSNDASAITGVVLPVDGGYSLW
ncbi:MAG: SDR family NAD(P)-dependent oxidoreductase [Bacteriovoracia bacterium]